MTTPEKPEKFWIVEYLSTAEEWEIQSGVFERTKKAAKEEWCRIVRRDWNPKIERLKPLHLYPTVKGRWK